MTDSAAFDIFQEDCEGMNIQITELGVIIINTDGTLSKIPNWHELTDGERKKAFRLIAKRNQRRREVLIQEQERGQELEQTEAESNGVAARRKAVEAAADAQLRHLGAVADERRDLLRQGKVLRCPCCFSDFQTGAGEEEENMATGTAAFSSNAGYCMPCQQQGRDITDPTTDDLARPVRDGEVLLLEN